MMKKRVILSDFTYFIRTMSDAAGIYAMPAMQSNALRADFT
mgnify:CR=1 FL=1